MATTARNSYLRWQTMLTTRIPAAGRDRVAGHGLAAADGYYQGTDDGQAARHPHVAVDLEGTIRLAVRDESLRGRGEDVS